MVFEKGKSMTIQVSRFTVCTFFCSVLLCGFLNIEAYKAIVIAPVADLLGEYAQEGESAYQHIPVSGEKHHAYDTCKREHQVLFHEIVDVVEEQYEQVKVAIPNFFFVPKGSNEKRSLFWMLKKNLYPLPVGEEGAVLRAQLPEPMSYQQPVAQQLNTVALILPYRDARTHSTHSTGTRFVVESLNEEQQLVTVYRLDKDTHCCTTMTVPKAQCLFPVDDKELQRKNFVELVRLWAHNPLGKIPYVLGGCSFVYAAADLSFKEVAAENGCSYYALDDANSFSKTDCDEMSVSPKTGFDCSGLVARAAQMAGLPYFYKNTTTLASYLTCLPSDKHLCDGDLIWVPGHVMIVSDHAHGLVVEARGYSSGWGRLHEIPLGQLFKDVETYADLEKLFKDQQPLKIIDKAGNVARTYETFKLLDLDSLFNT